MTDGGRFGILDGGGIEIDADDAVLDIPALLLVGLLDILGTCVDKNGLKENETGFAVDTRDIVEKPVARVDCLRLLPRGSFGSWRCFDEWQRQISPLGFFVCRLLSASWQYV